MTPDHFDARQKRWLALGLLGVVIIALIAGLILPLARHYYDNKNTIDILESQLEAYTAKIGSRNDVIRQATAMRSAINTSAIFSNQISIPLASADMQQRIKNTVASSGGELTSTQNLPEKQFDGLTKISMNVRFSGRIAALKKILYELESAKPYMIIEKIKILGATGQRNPINGKIEPVDKAHVSADIASYMLMLNK